MCEWCASHGCGEGLKLELMIKDEIYTCDCDKDHPRVEHSDGRQQFMNYFNARTQLLNAEAEVYEQKYDLYKDLVVQEPLSVKQEQQMVSLLDRIRQAVQGDSALPPCPGVEKDYDYVDCPDCGMHKKWVKKELSAPPKDEEMPDSESSSSEEANGFAQAYMDHTKGE